MIVKEHKTHDGRIVIAVCDSDILGKKFEEGDLQLDLTASFYSGEEKDEGEILKISKQKGTVNLNIVGKNSVDLFLKNNLIEKDAIMEINGIPYTTSVLINE